MLEIKPQFQCDVCNALFDEYSVHHYIEDIDGEHHFQDFYVPVCPCCGSDEITALPEDDDDLTAEEETEINRRDFEEWEWRREHT